MTPIRSVIAVVLFSIVGGLFADRPVSQIGPPWGFVFDGWRGQPVDVIVANLPYIPSKRISTLQPEVQWEPIQALDGGEDGLDLIKRLLQQASQGSLKPHGVIILEVDPEQVPPIQQLAAELFPQSEVSVEKDLAQMDRMVVISLDSEAD